VSSTWREVRRVVEQADVVLEVVDARDPWGTRVLKVERLAEELGKPLVIVINKADLVPKEVLDKWVRVLRREKEAVYISASRRLGTRKLWVALKKATEKRPMSVAVVGLPNVGKSTIINLLRGSHSVGTSPIPGFTKSVTRVRAKTWLRVIDTPGVVPRLDEEELALRSALRPEALEDPLPAAMRLVQLIAGKKPEVLEKLYGFAPRGAGPGEAYAFLEELARRRGLLGKGGQPLVEEAARVVLRDWQSGRNTFYLEPEDYGLDVRGGGKASPLRGSASEKAEKVVDEKAGSEKGDVG